jgi:hypothetical protein
LWHTTYDKESVARVKIIEMCKTMATRPDLLASIQAILGRGLTLLFSASLLCVISLLLFSSTGSPR